MKNLFILGSPRSGTTVLEEILSCYPDIAEFYEPYYLWERFFYADKDDIWDSNRLNENIINKIRREFSRYAKKSRKTLILDKSPLHSFNIPIINIIFPQAYWIHIVRDGRDVTLSIKKEWDKRKKIVQEKNFAALFQTTRRMLKRQPFWRYKLMAITYELNRSFSLNPYHYLNKSRWKGGIGWGPRFQGWEEYIATHSSMEFNAMQWVKTVEAALTGLDGVPIANRMEIRYETLLDDPEGTLTSVLNFLGYPAGPDFFGSIPKLKTGNTQKWRVELSPDEIELVKPILTPLLKKTGYLPVHPW